MRNKKVIVALIIILVVFFVLGFCGVVDVISSKSAKEDKEDRGSLVGVFVTNEYLDLFDMEAYLKANAGKVVSGKNVVLEDHGEFGGRIYARFDEDNKPVFDGLDGLGFFFFRGKRENQDVYWAVSNDDAIVGTNVGLKTDDNGDSIDLEGEIKVAIGSGLDNFYVNKVYQTEDGKVYLVSGQGTGFSGEIVEGMSTSVVFTDEQKVTVNEVTSTKTNRVKINIGFMNEPKSICILEYGRERGLVQKREFAPKELPNKFEVQGETEYLVVETWSEDGVVRELFGKEDDYLRAFYAREDGYCVRKDCEILW